MAYEDLTAFIRRGFELPIDGRRFFVPMPNARDGAWLQALMDGSEVFALTQAVGAANKAVLDDEQERTVYQLALGAAYDEMVTADVPWPIVKVAGMTAWLHWTRTQAQAEAYWAKALTADGPGNPTAPATGPQESSPVDGSREAASTLSPA